MSSIGSCLREEGRKMERKCGVWLHVNTGTCIYSRLRSTVAMMKTTMSGWLPENPSATRKLTLHGLKFLALAVMEMELGASDCISARK